MRYSSRLLFAPLMFICFLCCTLAEPIDAGDSKKILVRGSTSMESLVRSWAEQYMQSHPDIHITIKAEGSQIGLDLLLKGKTDVAMVSRRVTPAETAKFRMHKRQLRDTQVAIESVAITVNPDNPVRSVDLGELGGVFSGRISSWDEIGGPSEPIRRYIRSPNRSGTARMLKETLLVGARFAKDSTVLDYYEDTLAAVEKDKWGITFTPLNKLLGRHVKILGIRRGPGSAPMFPTAELMEIEPYPLQRFFHLCTLESAPEHVKAFVHYCWNRGLGRR